MILFSSKWARKRERGEEKHGENSFINLANMLFYWTKNEYDDILEIRQKVH